MIDLTLKEMTKEKVRPPICCSLASRHLRPSSLRERECVCVCALFIELLLNPSCLKRKGRGRTTETPGINQHCLGSHTWMAKSLLWDISLYGKEVATRSSFTPWRAVWIRSKPSLLCHEDFGRLCCCKSYLSIPTRRTHTHTHIHIPFFLVFLLIPPLRWRINIRPHTRPHVHKLSYTRVYTNRNPHQRTHPHLLSLVDVMIVCLLLTAV